jgi:hypothetical protein
VLPWRRGDEEEEEEVTTLGIIRRYMYSTISVRFIDTISMRAVMASIHISPSTMYSDSRLLAAGEEKQNSLVEVDTLVYLLSSDMSGSETR